MRARILTGFVAAVLCASIGASAGAATGTDGSHLPYFSLLSERVALKELPSELRLLYQGLKGPRGGREVWFGEARRPRATITAIGTRRQICAFEQPHRGSRGLSGACTTLAGARQLGLVDVSSCGKARHFRVSILVPNGVTGLQIEKAGGALGRTVPAIENTVAFTVGREDFTLRGVGDAAAEGLERVLPLGHTIGDRGRRGGCVSYMFLEAG